MQVKQKKVPFSPVTIELTTITEVLEVAQTLDAGLKEKPNRVVMKLRDQLRNIGTNHIGASG